VLFAGGTFWDLFPLRGLVSENWATLSWPARIADYFWHLALPLTCLVIGSFATMTFLTKNTFIEEMRKQYVLVARAKGLSSRTVMWKHVFRNALIPIVTGFPAAFIAAFFTGALLIAAVIAIMFIGAFFGFDASVVAGQVVIEGLSINIAGRHVRPRAGKI